MHYLKNTRFRKPDARKIALLEPLSAKYPHPERYCTENSHIGTVVSSSSVTRRVLSDIVDVMNEKSVMFFFQ